MRFMNLQYVKRYRMEIDLRCWQRPKIDLPIDYRLVAWHASLTKSHAEVKYQSFRGEIDAQVFPCLGQRNGCQRLMSEIQSKDGFLPEATWLAEYIGAGPTGSQVDLLRGPGRLPLGDRELTRSVNSRSARKQGVTKHGVSKHQGSEFGEALSDPWESRPEFCGTIQAVKTQKGKANIQNIGVEPLHRGRGIGTALILAALLGLHHLGIQRACLEVTAENEGAVRLYRQLGFRTSRTLYKAVELAYSEAGR